MWCDAMRLCVGDDDEGVEISGRFDGVRRAPHGSGR